MQSARQASNIEQREPLEWLSLAQRPCLSPPQSLCYASVTLKTQVI